MTHPILQQIGEHLPDVPPCERGTQRRAAVAALLRAPAGEPELLLIRRAEREGDPWSGHMALPGGRRDPEDADDAATAVRETHEELGIDLAVSGAPLGALHAVEPRSMPGALRVAPFVWAVHAEAALHPNAEVALAFWVPLAELAAPGAATEYLHAASGRSFAALSCRGQVVWGMTHRIVMQLLQVWSVAAASMAPADVAHSNPGRECPRKPFR